MIAVGWNPFQKRPDRDDDREEAARRERAIRLSHEIESYADQLLAKTSALREELEQDG